MYNNYNPYYQPYRQEQPMQQPMQPQTFIQQPRGLQGEQVDSIEVVKSMKIPLDGSVSYYPLTSGEMIITKQLSPDGTSRILTYKLATKEDEETTKYVTSDDLDKAIKKLDFEALEEEIESLKKQIKEMKKK